MIPNKRLSRRSFGRLLTAAPLAARPAPPQTASREEEFRAASQRRVSTAETLARFRVPMDTEPAFAFRP
jgi:hypothetical protein